MAENTILKVKKIQLGQKVKKHTTATFDAENMYIVQTHT